VLDETARDGGPRRVGLAAEAAALDVDLDVDVCLRGSFSPAMRNGSSILSRACSGSTSSTGWELMRTRPSPSRTVARATAVFFLPEVLVTM